METAKRRNELLLVVNAAPGGSKEDCQRQGLRGVWVTCVTNFWREHGCNKGPECANAFARLFPV